jgi:hypothetical protein
VTRVRPSWPDLPPFVRQAIEREAGGRVVAWRSHDGGFSPSWALTLTTTAGGIFVKVAGPEQPGAGRMHRGEAAKAALLPDGVPAARFRSILELSDRDTSAAGQDAVAEQVWVVVAFDVVPGRTLRTTPWDLGDLDLLGQLALRIAEHDVGSSEAFPSAADTPWPQPTLLASEPPAGLATYDPWLSANLERVADLASPARQAEAFAGDRLVHNDLRADNALVVVRDGREEGVAVDWPHAQSGAAFLDLAGILPSVAATGGPAPAEALTRIHLPPGTEEDAVTVWVAVRACYYVWSSLQDPPPGIPHLRAFQRTQGNATLAWLRQRLGIMAP